MADGDVRGAIRIMSSEESFAPFNAATKQALQALHPSRESPWIPTSESVPGTSPLSVEEAETRGAIMSFPPGSAGGLDMLRPQHLKDLIGPGAGNSGIKLLSSVKNLCNMLLAGEVPPEICSVLYGASLCALLKKKGGIRPIAVGCTWRRLVAKLGSNFIRPRLSSLFSPIQLGFGVKGGAEAAAHAARRYVSFDHKEPKVFLKIDFRNAFNVVNRDLLLQAVSEELPELHPFLAQCYGSPTGLAFGEEFLSSQVGIQQGDPLGPALFCLMVNPLASSVSSELNIWYLDDAAIGGRPEVVLCDFQKIVTSSAALGLEVNFAKCEVFILGGTVRERCAVKENFLSAAPNIRFPEAKECTLLGAPLFMEALAESLEAKSSALKKMSDRLGLVKTHVAFFLLKNSQAIPKLSYILRCSPTWKYEVGLQAYDAILKEALEAVSNSRLVDAAWEQSSLPVAFGGLGIRQAQALAIPAFLASVHSVSKLTTAILPAEVEDWGDTDRTQGIKTWLVKNGCELPDIDKRGSQKVWEAPTMELSKVNVFKQAATLQDKARLLGVASRESGAFLNAIPSASLGTLLDNDFFRIAIALRLGTRVCEVHVCSCGSPVDETGIHGLSCSKSAGRAPRHAAVNDLIRRGLGSANFPSTLEPSFLNSADNRRPDGVTLIPWAAGRSIAWDFTCTDSLAPSHVSGASVEPLYAASSAETLKRRKYAYLNQAYIFTPVAIECLGSVGRDGLTLLRSIGKKIEQATGEKRATEYFFQRISVAVQRGNALSVMGTLPPSTSLESFFSIL